MPDRRMLPILVAEGDEIAAARDGRAVLDSLDRDRSARVLMGSPRQRDLVEWTLLPLALEGTSPTGDLP